MVYKYKTFIKWIFQTMDGRNSKYIILTNMYWYWQQKQGGEVESRWAHNSKVGGSKPLSARFFILINKGIRSNKYFILDSTVPSHTCWTSGRWLFVSPRIECGSPVFLCISSHGQWQTAQFTIGLVSECCSKYFQLSLFVPSCQAWIGMKIENACHLANTYWFMFRWVALIPIIL